MLVQYLVFVHVAHTFFCPLQMKALVDIILRCIEGCYIMLIARSE